MASWVEDVAQALENLGGVGHLDDISREIEKIRPNLPASFRVIIRRELQESCAEMKRYRHKQDLFYSAEGLGNGV